MVGRFHGMLYLSAKHSGSCLMGKLHTKDVLDNLFEGPIIPFGSLVEYHPITAKDQSRIHQFGKKVLPGLFLGYALYAGGIWKTVWLQTLRSWRRLTHRKSTQKKTPCERGDISQGKRRIYFSNRRWTNKTCRRRSGTENIHLDTGPSNSRRRSKRSSWRIRRVSTFTTPRLISGCR